MHISDINNFVKLYYSGLIMFLMTFYCNNWFFIDAYGQKKLTKIVGNIIV